MSSPANKADDFNKTFKRSFQMSFNSEAANEKAEVFTKDLDEKLKSFNDKFMQNLTKSLTDQLFDISKDAEEKRKQTIGQSFVEKSGTGGDSTSISQSTRNISPSNFACLPSKT